MSDNSAQDGGLPEPQVLWLVVIQVFWIFELRLQKLMQKLDRAESIRWAGYYWRWWGLRRLPGLTQPGKKGKFF